MKILLFEDNPQNLVDHFQALKRTLADSGQAIEFQIPTRKEVDATYETLIVRDIKECGNQDATLIVADSDLSSLPSYHGLSEQVVRSAAAKLSIPECAYARGEGGTADATESLEWREQRIYVRLGTPDEFASKVVAIESGFATIRQRLESALKRPGRKTPGKILAEIIEKPEYADKVSLYASGDQNRLESALKKPRREDTDLLSQISCLLGYWLWDSVLRYPGVVLNDIAASSFLNISETDFAKPEVSQIFGEAIYMGPFAAAQGRLWWRGMLDDIVAGSKMNDGATLVADRLGLAIDRSRCCEDPEVSAGYYCVLSRKPVSLANSKPGLTWFPRGADLARISSSAYDTYVPWLQ